MESIDKVKGMNKTLTPHGLMPFSPFFKFHSQTGKYTRIHMTVAGIIFFQKLIT
jgi:hypothetical protein